MAVYWTDFGDTPTGQVPSGWTRRGGSSGEFSVETAPAGSVNGRALRLNPGSADTERLLSWGLLDGSGPQLEGLMRCCFASGGFAYKNTLYGLSGTNPAQNSWLGTFVTSGDGHFITTERYQNGSWQGEIAGAGGLTAPAPLQWYWLRWRLDPAEGFIYMRYWRASQSQPSSWTADGFVSVSGSGLAGVGGYTGGDVLWFDVVAFTTAGETAPMEDPDPSEPDPDPTDAAVRHGVGVGHEVQARDVPAQALNTPQWVQFTAVSGERRVTGQYTGVSGAASYEVEVQRLAGTTWVGFAAFGQSGTSFELDASDGVEWGASYRARVRAMP